MIDGRFDQHFLEIFAESSDRSDAPRPLVWVITIATLLALVACVGSAWPSASHLSGSPDQRWE